MGFERLVAGVIVIGLIVFGASILATPDEAGGPVDVDPVAKIDAEPIDEVDIPSEGEGDGDEDEVPDPEEGDDDGESRGKGKKGGG